MKARVSAIAQLAARDTRGAKYVVYTMLDPREPDPLGEYSAKPVYVGMTRDIVTRIKRRYHDAFTAGRREQSCLSFLRSLANDGMVAQFVVVHRSESAVEASDEETRWAQRLLAKGHQLLNQWPEQRGVVTADQLHRYLQCRLWQLPISAAIEEGLRISVSCDWCGSVTIFQPQEFQADFRSCRTIVSIRRKTSHCETCGTECQHKVLLRHEAAIPVARQSHVDWEP